MPYQLSQKLPGYLIRLSAEYERSGHVLEREVIEHSRIQVIEAIASDSFHGVDYHDVRLHLPLEILTRVGLKYEEHVTRMLQADLNQLARPLRNEEISDVHLILGDENDPDYQQAMPFQHTPPVNPEALDIWKSGLIRVFVSHRDAHKAKAHELAKALEPFGFSCFVAHDTIPTNEEWQRTILNGLRTMEVMLAYVTDDFHESAFCNQEIGFALGKDVPIISLRAEKASPPGFTSARQAEPGSISKPVTAAHKIAPILAKAVRKTQRYEEALVGSFLAAEDFSQAKERFERLKATLPKLPTRFVDHIVEGFADNEHLQSAYYLINEHKRLAKYIMKATDSDVTIAGSAISIGYKAGDVPSDDIPF